MATHNVSGIGTVTEKTLKKQESHDFENLKDHPDNQDVDSFNDLMNESIRSESNTAISGGDVALKEAPENLGDKILNSFQGMKENIDQRQQNLDKMFNSDEIMSMKDMMKTQKAMSNLMMTEDLIAKVVGKATQTVDTLMKQQ